MKRTSCLLLACALSTFVARGAWAADEAADGEPTEAQAASEDAPSGGEGEGAAKDDESAAAEDEAAGEGADEDYGHMGQLGLRVGFVLGYNMIFRYDSSPYCTEYDPEKSNKDQQKFCGHGAPPALNFGLSFALLDFFEPYLWVRLGLSQETETYTEPVKLVGIGARLYTMSDSAFKIYAEPAIAYEFEGQAEYPPDLVLPADYEPNYKKDLVFHFAAGPHLDFHQNFGAYASAGLTAGILRAIHTSLELDIGIQGRLP